MASDRVNPVASSARSALSASSSSLTEIAFATAPAYHDLSYNTLSVAQARLGTKTIKDTVNVALRRVGEDREAEVAAALDVLGSANLIDRSEAWR